MIPARCPVPVRMTNGLSIMDVVVPQRHLQGVQRQVGAWVVGGLPADDPARADARDLSDRAARSDAPDAARPKHQLSDLCDGGSRRTSGVRVRPEQARTTCGWTTGRPHRLLFRCPDTGPASDESYGQPPGPPRT